MRFLVLGGSGRTGKLVIDQALQQGHSVTALVRKALPTQKGLISVIGSPLEADSVISALTAGGAPADAILVTLNTRRLGDSPFAAPDPSSPLDFMTSSVRNAIAAMKNTGGSTRKIVVMSAAGTGTSMANVNFVMRFCFSHTNMRFSREDHDGVDQVLRTTSDIDFVEVRPWMLTDGEDAEVKVFPDDGEGAGWMPKISRKSVARFMVEAAEGNQYNGRTPVITN